jgi:hypothetical protein
MTRFEMLQRFASDERTEVRHIALFHAITESWNEAGRPAQLEADHDSLIHLSRIGKTTYRKTLAELTIWSYISYQPTASRHMKSYLSFPSIVSKSDTIQQSIVSESGTVSLCIPLIVSESGMIKRVIVSESGTIDSVIVSESGKVNPCILSESDTIGLFYRIRFRYGNTDSSTETPILAKTASSGSSFLPYNNNHLIKDFTSTTKGKVSGDDCVKGVQGKKQNRAKRENQAACKFADSPLADLANFRAAFADDPTGKAANLEHYYERVLNWRDKSGKPPERADWLATTKTFMLNDYREGKLITTIKPVKYDANPRNNNRSAIEPEPTPGRRFGSW